MIKELISFMLLSIFAFGWLDTMWIFGVENSTQYTWWYLIAWLAGGV